MIILQNMTAPILTIKVCFTIINTLLIGQNLCGHFKLQRKCKGPLFLKSLPDSIVEFYESKKNLYGYKLSSNALEALTNFINVFAQMDHINLSYLYANLHSNFVKKSDNKNVRNSYIAIYYPLNRPIYYECADLEEIIYHELLHMASTRICDKYEYSGFAQAKYIGKNGNKKFDIGSGLTEGYTELLTRRYFGKRGIKRSYNVLVDIANYIEVIVGREMMEELYFKGDLLGLVEILKQYISMKEVMILLKDLDYIMKALYESNFLIPELVVKHKYQKVLKVISKMLLCKVVKMDADSDLREEKAVYYSIRNHRQVEKNLTLKANRKTKRQIEKEEGRTFAIKS